MTGAVIENLSNRKLLGIFALLAIAQIAFFVLGALISPKPSSTMDYTMSTCLDRTAGASQSWFYIRPPGGCRHVDMEQVAEGKSTVTDGRQIVYVAQMPHPRDGVQLEFTPWFSTLLSVLIVDIYYDGTDTEAHAIDVEPSFLFEVRLGYGSHDAPWAQFVNATAETMKKYSQPQVVSCDPLELFELGSVDYPYYLLNMRVPGCDNATKTNCKLPLIHEMKVVSIHQNGGFTAVWLGMKTLLTPVVLVAVYWYWHRVRMMARHPHLLEKAIFALGVATVILDLPIEWLSLIIRTPFMLLVSDLRQGVFYAMLLSFWLIFTGEHLIDDNAPKNNMGAYTHSLTSVGVACTCMLLFDVAERGVHLFSNPFHSIWGTPLSTNLAYAFIGVTCVCGGLYLTVLAYKVCRVLATIKSKRHSLHQMADHRKLKFEGIIYRFRFLMILTFFCALMTVVGFLMEQSSEGHMPLWDEDVDEEGTTINVTSAFLTGTYGLWNIYVLLLLSMYAPSHKIYRQSQQVPTLDDDSSGAEDVMLTDMPSSTNAAGQVTQQSDMVEFIDNKRQD